MISPRRLMERLVQENAILAVIDSMVRSRKPGDIITRLPADQREVLKQLTSDDIQGVRGPGQ